MGVGDDRTDEDLFAALPDHAWSIHVGNADSGAKYGMPDPNSVRKLLHRFVDLK
jgi:trehalose 6-phosphate synthase/phosphatase